jgi:hypothetical protein
MKVLRDQSVHLDQLGLLDLLDLLDQLDVKHERFLNMFSTKKF